MATRQRLLDSVAMLLATTPYRDITVTDVARGAQTSPATYYQYFADIESAVIALAEVAVSDGTLVSALRASKRWRGVDGWANAGLVVDAFLEFWVTHQPVLRVVDLLTEEGDERLRAVRVRMLNAVTLALADVIGDVRASSPQHDGADPTALAGVLVSMLAHVAAHQRGFEAWDITIASVRDAMTDVLYWGITGPRLPDRPRPRHSPSAGRK